MERTRAYREWVAINGSMDRLLAPAIGLLVVLCIYLVASVRDPRHEYCPCGVRTGPSYVPQLHGPDKLERMPLLVVKPGFASLDGSHIFPVGADDDFFARASAGSRLAHRLAAQRGYWQQRHPDQPWPGRMLLKAHRDLPATDLMPYLWSARAEGVRRVTLYLRGVDRRGGFVARAHHSGAQISLMPRSRVPCAGACLELDQFETVDELARAVVALRRAGRPVPLALE